MCIHSLSTYDCALVVSVPQQHRLLKLGVHRGMCLVQWFASMSCAPIMHTNHVASPVHPHTPSYTQLNQHPAMRMLIT